MSRFSDDAFNLEGLNRPVEALPPGGVVELDQTLRVERLREQLPRIHESALRALEEITAEIATEEASQSVSGASEYRFDHREEAE